MFIWATVAVFRQNCAISSAFLAFLRAILGALFMAVIILVSRRPVDFKAIRKNLLLLFLAGAALGMNWVCMFQAYRYIPTSNATLFYNTAPMYVLLVSPFIFHEKLSTKKVICVIISFFGLVLVSGATGDNGPDAFRGILLSFLAAFCYAFVVCANKLFKDIGSSDRTIAQLFFSSLVALVYSLCTENVNATQFDSTSVWMALILGIVCTGIPYILYFRALPKLSSTTICIWSYILPVMTVVCGVVFLNESLTFSIVLGGLLILGSTFVAEWTPKSKAKTE